LVQKQGDFFQDSKIPEKENGLVATGSLFRRHTDIGNSKSTNHRREHTHATKSANVTRTYGQMLHGGSYFPSVSVLLAISKAKINLDLPANFKNVLFRS
jgi:hypothetical protein